MVGKRSALLILAHEFKATSDEVSKLADVLANPTIGGYQVKEKQHPPLNVATELIEQFFRNSDSDDVLLLYFTGHSRMSNDGDLYLILDNNTGNTPSPSKDLSASSIVNAMRSCHAREVAIILDSDFFPNPPATRQVAPLLTARDDGPDVFILASSLPGESSAAAITRGLRTGKADLDGDGLIHLDELHKYLQNDVTNQYPQVPPHYESLSTERFLFSRAPAWSIQTHGYGDRPPKVDLLHRSAMVESLVELVSARADSADGDGDGPTVIALDGAWGSGKTALIALTAQRLTATRRSTVPDDTVSRLTVCEALRALNGRGDPVWNLDMVKQADPSDAPPPVITAKFEPWAHQTNQQVWAGLTRSLLDSVAKNLLPTRSAVAERYWFQRNVDRVDRMRLRQSLHKNAISPLLAIASLALIVPIVAQLARSTDQYKLAGWINVVGSNLAVYIVLAAFFVGIGHTWYRYKRPAAQFLPADLFVGPIVSTAFAGDSGTGDEALRDPYYNARSGFLYLAQHDVFNVLKDVEAADRTVVLFIDDLDRCSPNTTAEVFEAINMFVNRTYPVTRFVLCLDTSAVATHLDHVHSALKDKALHGDDPSPGWSFLRKLIQLPIPIPPASVSAIEETLDVLLGLTVQAPPQESTPEQPTEPPDATTPRDDTSKSPQPSEPQGESEVGSVARFLEHDLGVRERVLQRLREQPESSVREMKRILTTWQFYVRVLIRVRALDTAQLSEDARTLVVLAEILTRWPAAQRGLHRRVEGKHGIQILVDALEDDWEWTRALRQLDLHSNAHLKCTDGLRDLLRRYDGDRLAALAAELT
ncbi:P-loop NTPase fold protein [Amycolatopsis sp. lyj-23]|uniref:P-loop NTPase fold protein n=1 Tax=Amycolatopsis sp. lyj-23 TaxID=2789283 RepID=UPI00397C861A